MVCSALKGPLHYRIIAGNMTEIDHLVTHNANVYALSANSDSGSSGMSKDWICVYDYDGCEKLLLTTEKASFEMAIII